MTRIIFIALASLAIVFGIIIGRAPAHQANLVKKQLDSLINASADIKSHEDFSIISREIAFKKSLMEASKSDSIYMVIDLGDSSLQLHIKGVPIHYTKMSQVAIDSWLTEMPTAYFNYLYANPMTITLERSTIVKEPVVVREAPKNPEEAAVNAYQPDTLIQNPAFVEFELSQNLLLILEQYPDVYEIDTKARKQFSRDRMSRNLSNKLSSVTHLKIPHYQPQIKMSLPVKDLRAIYRALPKNVSIILHLPAQK